MKIRARVLGALAGGALALAAAPAAAEPVRLLVAAGHKIGLAAERPLKFADNDATRVRDVMVALGGVRAEHAFVLAEPSRAQLFAAIERARIEALRHRADEVTLVFYFSGHGDREALHLGDERVPLSDVSAKLAEVPAGLRIAVTDACRATREKGFAADEPFPISVTTLPQASGQVWLHASSDGEAAQESDELQGAIFTHAWLNGLRGAADANGDARVTLEESFAFAHSQTLLRSAKSSGVLQKPEAVMNLREGAPVVLTQTAPRLATLSLPQARDTHFLVYAAGAKTVFSELWASPDRRTALSLPPGRYVVHKRLGATGGATQLALGEGEERRVEEKDFAPASLELLARKGEEAQEAPAPRSPAHHELAVGYEAGGNWRSGLVHGPRLGYAYAWGSLAVTLGGVLELSGRTLADRSEDLVGGYGRAGLELRVPVGMFLLRAGAGARAGVLAQTLVPSPGVQSVPGSSREKQTAFAFGPEVVLGARVGLVPLWYLDIGATGSVAFLREEGSVTGVPAITGGAGVSTLF